MAAELKPYRAYKDSGVEWLGAVPAHWEALKLRQVLRRRTERERPDLPLLSVVREQGVILRDTTNSGENHNYIPDDLSNYKVVRAGQFVMNKMKAWQGSYGVSFHDGIVSPAYYVFDVVGLRGDFFHAAIRSRAYVPAFTRASDGVRIGQWDLAEARMRDIQFLVPPASEQAAIVGFLDHADRRIRRYIRAKQQLIALLEEQRQAIILEAATGRIDVRTGRPYPGYEDTDVKWLGAVPAHWEVMRVKQVSRVLRGAFMHRPRNDPSLYDGPYPFIQTGEVAGADKRISSYRQTLNDRGLAVSRLFPAGTLVMAIAANIGDVAVLDFEACFPDSVVGFVPGDKIERDFLYYVFRAMRPELLREAPVNTQGNLNIDRVGSRRIPIPPYDEQRSVVRKIETNTVRLNAAIRQLECGVDLLREFRTRLVADVVTGKLDVREAAAGLPDLDLLATDDDPNDDFNRYARSEAGGDAEEGGPGPEVDTERSEAAARS